MKLAFFGNRADIISRINSLEDKSYQVVIEELDKIRDRTKTQNAFYWTLLGQYADWGRTSKIKLHNEMLMHYGQAESDADGNFIEPLFAKEVNWENATETHLLPLGQDIQTGLYRYRLLKNSRNYTTLEFSILITGLVNEIKGSGADSIIDTLTYKEKCLLETYKKECIKTKGKA